MNKNVTRRTGKVPSYTLSDKMISLVAEITEVTTRLEMREKTTNS